MLCSCCQPQSSPCDLTEARTSAPSPCPPWWVSRQASRAGEAWSAPLLHAGISLLCPPHPCCCALLRGLKLPPSATCSVHLQRGFLVCGNLSSFTAPSHWCRSHPYSFVSVVSFFFCPTQVRGEFLAFWEVWGLLPAFSGCSIGAVPRVDVFLMDLWGGRWSPHLTLPPSSPPTLTFNVLFSSEVLWFCKSHQHLIHSFKKSNLSTTVGTYIWLCEYTVYIFL